MINISEVFETHDMIEKENLDVRTITMGINLLDCAGGSVDRTCDRIRTKILSLASGLAATAATSYQGWFSRSARNRCPTMPVAPNTPTFSFLSIVQTPSFLVVMSYPIPWAVKLQPFFYARDRATRIISVKVFSRSWAVVASPVTVESDMVTMHSALAPAAAALAYRAAASISTASTPISAQVMPPAAGFAGP